MMKNLLVLMLVLCVASLASAAVTLDGPVEIAPGDTITIIIAGGAEEFEGSVFIDYATYGYDYYNNDFWTFSNYDVTDPTGIPSGSLSQIVQAYGGLSFTAANVTAGATVTAGDWFQFDLTLASGQTDYEENDMVDLDIYGSDWTTKGTGGYAIKIVPEPMTMALLGLGGLFLRRRK